MPRLVPRRSRPGRPNEALSCSKSSSRRTKCSARWPSRCVILRGAPACPVSGRARRRGRSSSERWASDRSDPEAPNPIYDEAKRAPLRAHRARGGARRPTATCSSCRRSPSGRASPRARARRTGSRCRVRPQVTLGDYTDYPFKPQVDEVTDVARRPGRSSSCATSRPRSCRSRTAPRGAEDFAVDPLRGTARRVSPSTARRPSGFRSSSAASAWSRVSRTTCWACARARSAPSPHLPGRLRRGRAGRGAGRVHGHAARAAQSAACPTQTTTSPRSSGPTPTWPRCAPNLRARMARNALDRARHVFADRVIEYATANATARPARPAGRPRGRDDDRRAARPRWPQQGIRYEDYLRVTEKTEAGCGPSTASPPSTASRCCWCSGHDRRPRERSRSPTPRSRPRSQRCAPTSYAATARGARLPRLRARP